jgi:PAS domain-containing protein
LVFNEQTAAHLVEAAARAVGSNPDGFQAVLNDIPAAIYVADSSGTITYFNDACVEAAGRLPEAGVDKWCVTWKLYTPEGAALPHDRCPMAVAIKEGREVRGVEIVAERPDGSRGRFIPYPTPMFDERGDLCGAVNLLIDVTAQPKPAFFQAQAEQCRRLATAVDDPHTAEMLALMAAKYYQQSRQHED